MATAAPQANAKLLAKLGGSSGTWRVGLINALGSRGEEASVDASAGLLRNSNSTAAAAAANALGKIGGSRAIRLAALKGRLNAAGGGGKQ